MVAWWWLLITGVIALILGGLYKHNRVEDLELENWDLRIKLKEFNDYFQQANDPVKNALLTIKKFLREE